MRNREGSQEASALSDPFLGNECILSPSYQQHWRTATQLRLQVTNRRHDAAEPNDAGQRLIQSQCREEGDHGALREAQQEAARAVQAIQAQEVR